MLIIRILYTVILYVCAMKYHRIADTAAVLKSLASFAFTPRRDMIASFPVIIPPSCDRTAHIDTPCYMRCRCFSTGVLLFVNEYDITRSNVQTEAYYDQIKNLTDQGAPIHGER